MSTGPKYLTQEDQVHAAAALRAGDHAAFSAEVERHRRELQVHCYRMLGSFDEAEDLAQETLLRAWKSRDSFEGRSSLRAWLYRIATNACLDALATKRNRVMSSDDLPEEPAGLEAPPHVPWLQPYPDRLLEPEAPPATAPDAVVASRENVSLAFLVALQFLPAKQRAVLIMTDVLDWSAKETAALLELSVAAVNAALQRARATLRAHQTAGKLQPTPAGSTDADQRDLIERYLAAHERSDVQALTALLREDLRFSMPPEPGTYAGRDSIVHMWIDGGFGSPSFGELKCLSTHANRMPAVAIYRRRPGEKTFHPLALDVLRVENGLIAEITTFCLESMREAFELPAEIEG